MAKDNNSRRDKKDSKANDVAMITGLMGFDKPQPHNLDVETAILSSILRQPKPCADIVISELGEDCEFFYSHVHRIIYKAILEVYRESIAGSVDLVSIAHKLDTQKRLEENGKNRLEAAKGKSIFRRFMEQLADPMIIILLAAAAVSGILAAMEPEGEFVDVIIIDRHSRAVGSLHPAYPRI